MNAITLALVPQIIMILFPLISCKDFIIRAKIPTRNVRIHLKIIQARRTYIKNCCERQQCPNVTIYTSSSKVASSMRIVTLVPFTTAKILTTTKPTETADYEETEEITAPTSFPAQTTTTTMLPSTTSSPTTSTQPTIPKVAETSQTTSTSTSTTTTSTSTSTTTTSTSTTTTAKPVSTSTTTTKTSTTFKATTQSSTTTSTSTTSTSATTEKPDCMPYTCAVDPALVQPNGEVKVIKNPEPNVGSFWIACNSIYFISAAQTTWQTAAANCCKRNMTLLAIETDAEYKCLTNFIFKNTEGNYYTDKREYFWTSGSDYGVEGVHKWCYPGGLTKPMDTSSLLRWNTGNPDNYLGKENCDIVNNFAAKLPNMADVACDAYMPYICEAATSDPNPFPQCPSDLPAEPSKTAMVTTAVNALNGDPSMQQYDSGSGPIFFKTCGKNYFYLKTATNFNFVEGYAECTKYGVKVLSLETFAEVECLFNYNRDYANQSAYFWTSGTNLGPLTAKTFAWCSTKEFFNISKTKVWDVDQGQPDGFWFERCTSLDWQKDFLYKNGMHDFGCNDKIGVICEI